MSTNQRWKTTFQSHAIAPTASRSSPTPRSATGASVVPIVQENAKKKIGIRHDPGKVTSCGASSIAEKKIWTGKFSPFRARVLE